MIPSLRDARIRVQTHHRAEAAEVPRFQLCFHPPTIKVSEIIVVNHWFDDLILHLFLWGTPLAFSFPFYDRPLRR